MLYTAKGRWNVVNEGWQVDRLLDSLGPSAQPDPLAINSGVSTNLRGDKDRRERNAEVPPGRNEPTCTARPASSGVDISRYTTLGPRSARPRSVPRPSPRVLPSFSEPTLAHVSCATSAAVIRPRGGSQLLWSARTCKIHTSLE